MSDTPNLDRLPVYDPNERRACPKGTTRLEQREEAKKLTLVTERSFRHAVWTRDKHLCRCCRRKVEKVVSHVVARGEVHHIHGRTGDLRFEVRAALLLCLKCHQRVTGKVNDKLAIVATVTFTTREGTFTDATYPVEFRKVA